MKRALFALAASVLAAGALRAGASADGPVIETMDTVCFHPPREKGRLNVVPGKVGSALRFAFDNDCRSTFFTSGIRGAPEWDEAAGFSFWVKGDGSDQFGGLEFIYDEDYAVRYDVVFPLRSSDWTQVKVAWGDLIPVLPGPKAKPLDPARGNRPSRLSALWVGRWWYWPEYPPHSFALDDLRLERSLPADRSDYRPAGPPLGRVLARLRARQPVTIVTMGDSLTDPRHWSNRQTRWPELLRQQLSAEYGSTITIESPAIGGTQLEQNLALIPLWQQRTPEPDLVTLLFGSNDWEAGVRGPVYAEQCRDAVDRIRRATQGKADVLLMTTVPTIACWTVMAELSEAARRAARERNAGLADTDARFHQEGATQRDRLFAQDQTHMGAPGHELIARTVVEAIARGGR